MAATVKAIRETTPIEPTAQDKGLVMTIKLVAYDKAMIEVNGIPMTDPEAGWLDAATVICLRLQELQRQARKRAKTLAG